MQEEQAMRRTNRSGCGLVVRFESKAQRQAYEQMIDRIGKFEDTGIRIGARLKRRRVTASRVSTRKGEFAHSV